MAKIQERETMSKKLSKYIAAVDYFVKALLVLFATSGVVYIAYHRHIINQLSYCLKCKRNQKLKTQEFQQLIIKRCFYQNVQCVII